MPAPALSPPGATTATTDTPATTATTAIPTIPRPVAGWFRRLRTPSRRISLALQGGGAHGAFTWGVLDALMEDPRVEFEGLSGSSAGAMNAVVLADGWMKGGREGARESLAEFWNAVGQQMPIGMVTRGEGESIRLAPVSKLLATWAGYFSPSQLNPLDLNPLRDLLERQVDFSRLRAASPFKLFVGATQASTGKLRVFREGELTVDMLLASACLPKIHHAIEIDGESYWDGGYSANPAVFPLFYDCDTSDVLLVLLSPLRREGTPRTVEEIESRIAELGFQAHFMREMGIYARAAAYTASSFLVMGRLERRLQKMRFHMVDANDLTTLQRTDTKLIAHGPFLELLREQGRTRARAWLGEHFEAVGRRSTLDLQKWFD
jgi:NTE family protein